METPNWDPERRFGKICPVCQKEFFSLREDKKYCCKVCKDYYSNQKAKKERKSLKENAAILKNLRIITLICDDTVDVVFTKPIQDLLILGFKPETFTGQGTKKGQEGVWQRVGDYVFQLTPDKQSIHLLKYQ